MEFVDGDRVRDVVDSLEADERRSLFRLIGVMAGRLHGAGIVHGDLRPPRT